MQVSIQEFKSQVSHYVAQSQSDVIELTSQRKVVARLIGVTQHSDDAGVERLLAAGVASWQGGKPAGAMLTLQAEGTPVSQMAMEDRA